MQRHGEGIEARDRIGRDGLGGEVTGRGRGAIPMFQPQDYDRAAREAADDDGMLPEEVEQVLAGRSLVRAFPVEWHETPGAYAARAVAEMMVAYIALDTFPAATKAGLPAMRAAA